MSGVCPIRCLLELQGYVEVIETFSIGHFAGEFDEATVAWLYFGQRCGAALYHATVAEQTPMECEVAHRSEAVTVADAYLLVVGQLEIDVLIDLLDLKQLGGDVAVGCDDAVATEVPVVGIVVEAAAVVHVGGWLTPFAEALVHPVPYAAAYCTLAFELDVVPILL